MKFLKKCKNHYIKIKLNKNVDVNSSELDVNIDSMLNSWLREIVHSEIMIDWVAEYLYISGLNSIFAYQQGYRGDGWDDAWTVFAKWTGDPIIYNIETKEVLTAMHGVGEWQPYPIAPDLGTFDLLLSIWCKLYYEKYDKLIMNENFELLDVFSCDLRFELSKILDRKYLDGFFRFITS